jgi:enamine deaminase RidA (YjgF/YER057c/UK114 family)
MKEEHDMKVEQKLAEMGIELKKLGPCSHPILHAKRAGNLLFISGHGTSIHGKLGADLKVEDGYAAAREAAIHCLEAARLHVDTLDKVKGVVKVFGMVNSAPDFIAQPAVMNGASELLIAAFGEEKGGHARSAVGMASLPNGIAVEVEMVLELED